MDHLFDDADASGVEEQRAKLIVASDFVRLIPPQVALMQHRFRFDDSTEVNCVSLHRFATI